MKNTFLFLSFLLIPILISAQKTRVFTEDNYHFKQAKSYYDKGLYGLAKQEFQKTIDQTKPINTPQSNLLQTQAELYLARTLVQMELPEGEKLILEFIRKNQPDPIADDAVFEIGNYYFNAKEYDKANEFYSLLNNSGLNAERKSEVRFKQGYSSFVRKKFRDAAKSFGQIADLKTEYYYPTNYYLGMCHYFTENYDAAISHFNRVEKSSIYRASIPYYITQINFSQKKYSEVISYGEEALSGTGRNKYAAELHQMVGQAYFEQRNYEAALPHLEYYESHKSRLRKEDFYQLAYTQYVTGHYDKAINSFLEINNEKSEMGQNANFYLANCYLNTGDKKSARTAFYECNKLDYNPEMQEDALFYFAQLSAELDYDRDAINALTRFTKSSKYYLQAQEILSDVFVRTRDYAGAIRIIESLPERTPQINAAYQKVTYFRGLQKLNEAQLGEAEILFNKSLTQPIDKTIQALCGYWKGDIAHRQQDYSRSELEMNKFFTLAKNLQGLPEEASIPTAHYLQGYNHFKRANYTQALQEFKPATDGIKSQLSYYKNDQIPTRMLPDALMRLGDCYFKQNAYKRAGNYYNETVRKRYKGYQYAMFQNAIIQGLTGNTEKKIKDLRDLIDNHGKSEYTDDALLELGATYQETDRSQLALTPLRRLVSEYGGRSNLINEALLKLGLIYYNEGEYNEALKSYKAVFQHNPSPQESQEALAAIEEIYVQDLGRPDDYFAFLETVPGYKLDNFAKDSLNFKAADIHYEGGNYQKAITGYTNYLNRYPNGAFALIAYYRRGESYSLEKDFDRALTDYEHVINKGNSEYYESALYKAALISYNHSADFAKAYRYYQKLQEVSTSEERQNEAQVGALQCAYRLNKAQEVYTEANKVISNSRTTTPQKATAHFYTAKVSFDQKKWDDALASFNSVIKLTDNEQAAEARYLIGLIYYNRKEYDISLSIADNAVKENTGFPQWAFRSLILVSDNHVAKKDYHLAKAPLSVVIENGQEYPEIMSEAQRKLTRVNQLQKNQSRIDPGNQKLLQLENGNNE